MAKTYSFINPAEAMLQNINNLSSTETTAEPVAVEPVEEPTRYVIKEECRSKHVQLLFQPSLLKAVDKAAKKQKKSRNKYIEDVLKEYLDIKD